MAPAAGADDAAGGGNGGLPSPPGFTVLHDKPLAVERVALCPKMDLAALVMADGQ